MATRSAHKFFEHPFSVFMRSLPYRSDQIAIALKMSRACVDKWRSGASLPSLETMALIASEAGVPGSQLSNLLCGSIPAVAKRDFPGWAYLKGLETELAKKPKTKDTAVEPPKPKRSKKTPEPIAEPPAKPKRSKKTPEPAAEPKTDKKRGRPKKAA